MDYYDRPSYIAYDNYLKHNFPNVHSFYYDYYHSSYYIQQMGHTSSYQEDYYKRPSYISYDNYLKHNFPNIHSFYYDYYHSSYYIQQKNHGGSYQEDYYQRPSYISYDNYLKHNFPNVHSFYYDYYHSSYYIQQRNGGEMTNLTGMTGDYEQASSSSMTFGLIGAGIATVLAITGSKCRKARNKKELANNLTCPDYQTVPGNFNEDI
jgi:hypothetical protein